MACTGFPHLTHVYQNRHILKPTNPAIFPYSAVHKITLPPLYVIQQKIGHFTCIQETYFERFSAFVFVPVFFPLA